MITEKYIKEIEMIKNTSNSSTIKFCFTFVFIALLAHPLAQARELVIGFAYDIPPYITKDATGGMEIDIVREALNVKGHTFSPKQYIRMNSLAMLLKRTALMQRPVCRKRMTVRFIRTTSYGLKTMRLPKRLQVSR